MSVALGADYVKVVEDSPILSAADMYAKESRFSDISLTAILAGDDPYRERESEALPSR